MFVPCVELLSKALLKVWDLFRDAVSHLRLCNRQSSLPGLQLAPALKPGGLSLYVPVIKHSKTQTPKI